MNPDDDFFIRLGYIPRSWSDKNKFNTWNPKSLGFMLVSLSCDSLLFEIIMFDFILADQIVATLN